MDPDYQELGVGAYQQHFVQVFGHP
jgi:hypothetical protein